MRVGLVLGAGGYAGQAFHAGVLKALWEATGWDPRSADVIVGTSAGSGVAGWLRAGLGAADLYARVRGERLSPEGLALTGGRPVLAHAPPSVERSWRPSSLRLLARSAARPWDANLTRVATAALPRGTRSTRFIAEEARRVVGRTWPQRPMWICAVDLDAGLRTVFGRPDAPPADPGSAVAASCAIPSYFAPVEIGGRPYVDGGIHSPTNADVLRDQPLDLVLVCSPMSVQRGHGRRSFDYAARLHARRLLGREHGVLRRAGMTVRVFQPCDEDLLAMGLNAMNPACRPGTAEQVRASARERLARAEWIDLLRAGPKRTAV